MNLKENMLYGFLCKTYKNDQYADTLFNNKKDCPCENYNFYCTK